MLCLTHFKMNIKLAWKYCSSYRYRNICHEYQDIAFCPCCAALQPHALCMFCDAVEERRVISEIDFTHETHAKQM